MIVEAVKDRRRARSATGWISIHLSLPDHVDEFLIGEFSSFVEESRRNELLKRVFFIRHSEGGPHIRVRLMPKRGPARSCIVAAFRECVTDFAAKYSMFLDACAMSHQTYDRTLLYFGDTWESVYSELINEQTSLLALRLVRAFAGEPVRLVIVVAALFYVLLDITKGSALADALAQSREFARRCLGELQWPELQPSDRELEILGKAIREAVPSIRRMSLNDAAVGHLTRLLRRACNQCGNGQELVIHSLHLLCNKVGITLAVELEIYTILSGLGSCL